MTIKERTADVLQQAQSVVEFCSTHRISKAHFYNLCKAGIGPRLMKVGRRTLITEAAAADWRRMMEASTVLAA